MVDIEMGRLIATHFVIVNFGKNWNPFILKIRDQNKCIWNKNKFLTELCGLYP